MQNVSNVYLSGKEKSHKYIIFYNFHKNSRNIKRENILVKRSYFGTKKYYRRNLSLL